ncbi:MAG: PfkB family carbohydrate kinase [Synergistaceae bacterium]|jgi:ribokinase|nr:PfkB family carbohydrate kinase [Synergistaceae bacterium]
MGMRIEDIAKLAHVSISTVSKVVNGKDHAINPKTRARVLAIVREYNYTPYSSVKNNGNQKTFLIGFLYSGSTQMEEVLEGVMKCARDLNYCVIPCKSGGDPDIESRHIAMLCRSRVDGVLWEKLGPENKEPEAYFERHGITFASIGGSVSDSGRELSGVDYSALGYKTTKKLTDLGHQRIGCVVRENILPFLDFSSGFRRCLYEQQIFFDEKKYIIDASGLKDEIFSLGYTGLVCADEDLAEEVCRLARRCSLVIPRDLSLVALLSDGRKHPNCRASWIRVPLREYGESLCGRLIATIEKTEATPPRDLNRDADVENDDGIDVPYDSRRKNILVIGSINIDVLINVEDLPQVGKTMNINAISTIPGGKGLNQAVGAAKLGANVSLIAKIGRDAEGASISSLIVENKIDSQGISVDENLSTGKAFIYIPPDGDSSIIVYAGANNNLSAEDISKNESLFRNASYCLLPMEIPENTVEFAADMARSYGVATILKPSALGKIKKSLLEKIDIFVPNEKEAAILCPRPESIEDRALYFLDRGVKLVIITMGASGCYMRDAERSRFYPADSFPPLDTTGGADAFISALAVYLNEKTDISEAIRRANCAAGFCVSRKGVLPAMVDRVTLELYLGRR